MDQNMSQKNVGFWFRFFSFIIDLSALIVISQLFSALLFLHINIEQHIILNIVVSLIFFVLIALGIELVFKTSIGKFVFGIETVKNDSTEVSRKDLLVKTILKILYPIEAFVIIFSKTKRTIANRITKTNTVWKNEKIRNRLLKVFTAITSIAILMNILLFVMSYSYMNTNIFAKSTEVIQELITDSNDKKIGYIDNYSFPPNNIQIINDQGIVVRKVTTKNKTSVYLEISLIKENNEWKPQTIKVVKRPSGKGFSISYSAKNRDVH